MSTAMCNLGVSHLSLSLFFVLKVKTAGVNDCKMKLSVSAKLHRQASSASDWFCSDVAFLFV